LDAFSNTEGIVAKEQVHAAAGTLLEILIDRLGDSNLRLHESARKCVLFTAEHPSMLGLGAVLARLRARLTVKSKGSDKQKTHFGILDAAHFLVSHCPGQRGGDVDDGDDEADTAAWKLEDVAPLIVAGMDDALGPRVRTGAIALAVTTYQTFGMEAMLPMLEGLRPAKQALLKQKFKEAETAGEFSEDSGSSIQPSSPRRIAELNALVISGTGMKPVSGTTLPPLFSAPGMDDEECFMDGILEEAGMVFGGGGGIANDGYLGIGDEEQMLLEQELRTLGMDLEGLDEQQALLSSLQYDGPSPSFEQACKADRLFEQLVMEAGGVERDEARAWAHRA
jgi:hypothetical protein